MTNVSLPRALGRTTVAAGAAALLAFGLAAPAAADNAARAQYTGMTGPDGVAIVMGDKETRATLFELTLEDGDTLSAYCIDLETYTRDNAWYVEDDWANYPGRGDFSEPGKVHWVLQHGYPTVSAQKLGAEVRLPRLTESEAMAATQAAIWHFTNGVDLTRAPGNVTKLYDHLVENAEDLSQEPGPSLSVTPGEESGEAGSIVGGFTIETNSETAIAVVEDPANPDGVDLVDMDGNPVTEVENGDKVGFEVPAGTEAGQASFSLETTAEVSAGRLFQGEDPNNPTQTLITAKKETVTVSASATATWTAGEEPSPSPSPSEEPSESPEPSPTPSESPSTPASPEPSNPADDRDEPSLPVTGGALAGLVAAGIAALGAGGGAIYLSRKRKAASAQE
ncbi:thioester domain-containing protein [Nocardiopsis sp. CC223A]|uniref:thioester domain-containing protein n=1 Tax=Nocardiopsis sp. CC223A TaxID=3044051 RepID=UPI00278C23AD|nr:thioester domain-containing protein [Nocardiopsis sp. CC223A]